MAVSVSFIGGAGWQFFDDNGDPLSGGKIFTYAAGTTTPQTTYTSRDGLTPNTNPIILDAAGRTPQEIWTTEGILYKYVIKNADNVLIRSWDNIGASVVASDLAQDLANTTDNSKGDALVGFRQSNASGFLTGAVARTVNDKLQEYVSVKDFGAVGDGVTDDTAAIQAAFDSIGTVTAGAHQDISPKGMTLYFPAGRYLVTSTLFMPSNVRMQGVGMGTQFKFDPTTPNSHFLREKNTEVSGSALNRSNFSMHFENFLVFAARGTGTVIGRDGAPTTVINPNTADCFNLTDVSWSSFTNVIVTDFWYGTGFNLKLDLLFAYYNYMIGCAARNCQLGVQTTSASHLSDCYFSHDVTFPPPSLQPNVKYAVSFEGFRGCAMHGGSIECVCSVALIKQNNAGHAISGVYMEAPDTPAIMDASNITDGAGSLLFGGNSLGYTQLILYNENVTRSSQSQMTFGAALNYGDCALVELENSATREAPSFREGLPGNSHFPAGGALTISTDSFVDNTSMALARGAGTSITVNQMTYSFRVRNSNKLLTNMWLTCLLKLEGGENNFSVFTNDATNGNAVFNPILKFNNGWWLYATYLKRVNNDDITLFVRQLTGSTDPSQVLKITSLRAYTNGFLPVPGPYSWPEYRAAIPSTGTWRQGDIVWRSQPVALGTPGWVCTTGGSPGTWSPMASLV